VQPENGVVVEGEPPNLVLAAYPEDPSDVRVVVKRAGASTAHRHHVELGVGLVFAQKPDGRRAEQVVAEVIRREDQNSRPQPEGRRALRHVTGHFFWASRLLA
jgi:hypothetical protein